MLHLLVMLNSVIFYSGSLSFIISDLHSVEVPNFVIIVSEMFQLCAYALLSTLCAVNLILQKSEFRRF